MIDMKTVKPENGLLTIKLSGWKKESPNGNRYLSLAVNLFEKEGGEKAAPAADDDVPF